MAEEQEKIAWLVGLCESSLDRAALDFGARLLLENAPYVSDAGFPCWDVASLQELREALAESQRARIAARVREERTTRTLRK
jgi:hypothetical protein